MAKDSGAVMLGCATSDSELLELTKQLRPDVVLYDLFSSSAKLNSVVSKIVEFSSATKVLILNYEVSRALLSFCLCAGACGLADKTLPANDLVGLAKIAKTGVKITNQYS